MKLENLVPILWVDNLDETIRFYGAVLGFECTKRMDAWAFLKKDDVELMISLPNEDEPFDKLQFTGSFYFHPDDVDALWQQIKNKATIVYPIEDFDYGMREFAIRDNTGYILQFGQSIG